MSDSSTIIQVTDLHKRFGQVRALDGFDLEVVPGIFGLIGPNGAGKTTLLRTLLGLIRPDQGTASVLGHDSCKDSLNIRKRVGVLHERPKFPTSMTAERYLTRVGKLYGSSRKPTELLSFVGLSNASNRKVGNLSAGMHQRLGIAQALIGNPELVFLDEPTSNLDVSGRDEVIRLIISLHQELGVSFFISSHILSELERACHKVAFIRAGQVVENGAVLDIIDEHTKYRFRIVTSDSKSLFGALKEVSGIVDAIVSGANTISVTVEESKMEVVQTKVEELAKLLGIRVYAFEHAGTLEDAYKEVMRTEEQD
jgi:ABC-2 type transport system ATP-binding protein